uniref:Uncharacterized protein n=1 Tax=Picea sitchensis TaxID=3332 RepID=A0A6B9XRH3_PICSI|nr:hypothetical protein Q903MT_gene4252 [Picea sitchensis]
MNQDDSLYHGHEQSEYFGLLLFCLPPLHERSKLPAFFISWKKVFQFMR